MKPYEKLTKSDESHIKHTNTPDQPHLRTLYYNSICAQGDQWGAMLRNGPNGPIGTMLMILEKISEGLRSCRWSPSRPCEFANFPGQFECVCEFAESPADPWNWDPQEFLGYRESQKGMHSGTFGRSEKFKGIRTFPGPGKMGHSKFSPAHASSPATPVVI